MYDVGVIYKFELSNSIFYTGKVLEENSIHLKIIDKFDIEQIFNKDLIQRSWKRNGDRNESSKK